MKKKLALVALATALATQFAGCYRMTTNVGPGTYPEPAYKDAFQHQLFGGLAQIEGPINVANLCPNGVAQVRTKISFVNGLVTFLTGFIYSPASVKVYCSSVTGN